MGKVLFSGLLLLAGLSVSAQNTFSLGQKVRMGDVPGFVYYLDDSGEHGLVMSMPAPFPGCRDMIEKAWTGDIGKKERKEFFTNHPSLYFNNGFIQKNKLDTPKKRPAVYADLIPRLGVDGQANAIAIKAYCAEKGFEMSDYFPWEYWAEQLGDGWFIPGKRELELFAVFFCGGMDKENGCATVRWASLPKELSRGDKDVQWALWAISYGGNIISSTAEDPERGFEALCSYVPKIGAAWFYWGKPFRVKVEYSYPVCAVYRF